MSSNQFIIIISLIDFFLTVIRLFYSKKEDSSYQAGFRVSETFDFL